MPTMTFSFVCHTAVLPIYAELGGGEGQEKGTADFDFSIAGIRRSPMSIAFVLNNSSLKLISIIYYTA